MVINLCLTLENGANEDRQEGLEFDNGKAEEGVDESSPMVNTYSVVNQSIYDKNIEDQEREPSQQAQGPDKFKMLFDNYKSSRSCNSKNEQESDTAHYISKSNSKLYQLRISDENKKNINSVEIEKIKLLEHN